MVPTPTFMLAVEETGAAGGIGVTASHNPGEWNAMKFASGEGVFLDAGVMAEAREAGQEEDGLPAQLPEALGDLGRDDMIQRLEREMKKAAEDLKFELAASLRDRILDLQADVSMSASAEAGAAAPVKSGGSPRPASTAGRAGHKKKGRR